MDDASDYAQLTHVCTIFETSGRAEVPQKRFLCVLQKGMMRATVLKGNKSFSPV